jgi:hypothetical protein
VERAMLKIWNDLWAQPKDHFGLRDAWFAKYYAWRLIFFISGMLSICFPAIAAATPKPWSSIFSVAATITAGIIGFLGAKDQKDKFNVAWHILSTAINSGSDISAIRSAILRGESIINADSLQKYAPDLYAPSANSEK